MIDEHEAANIPAALVFEQFFDAQFFDKADRLYWVKNEPVFGRQAVSLYGAN